MPMKIDLPDECRCPVCGEPLKLFHFKKKVLFRGRTLRGHPMVGCLNWGKCSSPWRQIPRECPWHAWLAFDENGAVVIQRGNHALPKEDDKRREFLEQLLQKLRSSYPTVYKDVMNFVRAWTHKGGQ